MASPINCKNPINMNNFSNTISESTVIMWSLKDSLCKLERPLTSKNKLWRQCGEDVGKEDGSSVQMQNGHRKMAADGNHDIKRKWKERPDRWRRRRRVTCLLTDHTDSPEECEAFSSPLVWENKPGAYLQKNRRDNQKDAQLITHLQSHTVSHLPFCTTILTLYKHYLKWCIFLVGSFNPMLKKCKVLIRKD